MKSGILGLIASTLLGCTPQVIYVYPEIPLPTPPVYPTVYAEEFVEREGGEVLCISWETYEKLAVIETLRTRYAEELRELIKWNNERNVK